MPIFEQMEVSFDMHMKALDSIQNRLNQMKNRSGIGSFSWQIAYKKLNRETISDSSLQKRRTFFVDIYISESKYFLKLMTN